MNEVDIVLQKTNEGRKEEERAKERGNMVTNRLIACI